MPHSRPRVLAVSAVVAFLLVPASLAPRAWAQPALAPRVPLTENFSPLEITVSLAVAGAGTFLLAQGRLLFDPPKPSMGPPDPGSIDARVSRWAYQQGSDRMWGGVPDVAGAYLLPVLPALFYGGEWLSWQTRGRPLFACYDQNPQHRLMAFVEAMGWTYLLTGLVKYTAGRPRPYTEVANDHPQLRHRASEDNLSFFSGHASVSFAVGAFLAEDTSRYLLRGPLSEEAGAGTVSRVLLGRVAPYLVGYGVPAVIGVSRIVDQQHWPSDVVTGAVTGALIAHLVYAVHFDAEGNPQRRHPVSRLVPLAGRGADGVQRLVLAYYQQF
jgi:membrane-associated phospholipid phosphatase